MSKYISIDAMLGRIKDQLDITHTQDDLYLRRKIFDGERRINSLENIERHVERLDITNKQSILPEGSVGLVALKIETEFGCVYPFYSPIYFPCIEGCGNTINNSFGYNFDIQGDFINFSSAVKELECEISYYRIKVDKNGLPLLLFSHAECLENYVCWQYEKRSNPMSNNAYDYKSDFKKLATRLQASANTPSEQEMVFIGWFWSTKLSNKNFKY